MATMPKMKIKVERADDGGCAVHSKYLLGLSVHHKEDGCWLRFKASNGREAMIDLAAYAKDRGPIVRSAIEQWIEDVRPNAPRQDRREATYPERDCSALDSEHVEPEDRVERCDQCGDTRGPLLRGLCPMCCELNGGTHE